IRFERFEGLDQFGRGRISAGGQRPKPQRGSTRRAHADKIPARQLLMVEKETFHVPIHKTFATRSNSRVRRDVLIALRGGLGTARPTLVVYFINTHTFAAMDFGRRPGASDEHIPQWICKEQATTPPAKRHAALRVAPNLA